MKDKKMGAPQEGAAPECTERADGKNGTASSDTQLPVDLRRRIAVLGAVGGASALVAWHKPVIEAVLLPAHAQMSMVVAPAAAFFAGGVAAMTSNMKRSPLDFLISSAYAGEITMPLTSEYTIEVMQTGSGVDSYDIRVFEKLLEGSTDAGQVLYRGTASEASGGNLSVMSNPCDLAVESIDVTIESISGEAPNRVLGLNFTSRSQMLQVPEGSGMLPMPECLVVPPPDYAVEGVPVFNNAVKFQSDSDRKFALLDLMVPKAHAGMNIIISPVQDAIAINNGDGTFQVSYQRNDIGRFSGGPLSVGIQGSLSGVQNCDQMLSPIDATITGVTDTELTLDIQIGFREFGTTLILPVADPGPMLPDLECLPQG